MQELLSRLPLKQGVNLRNTYTKDELNRLLYELHSRHINGESITSFNRLYGLDRTTLRNNFKRLNLNIINHQNKLRVKENIFNSIQTEEDAYWLGFIYADGYISDGGTVAVDLKSSDVSHLIKLSNYLGLNESSVKINNGSYKTQRARLSFAGKGKELNKLGVVPRKSLILTFPKEDQVPTHLIRHFIRGYFDGDGCYSVHKGKKPTHKKVHTCSILGTNKFLTKLKDVCPIETNSLKQKGNIWVLIYNTTNAKLFVDWIYKDTYIYLERKYEKYLKYSPSV